MNHKINRPTELWRLGGGMGQTSFLLHWQVSVTCLAVQPCCADWAASTTPGEQRRKRTKSPLNGYMNTQKIQNKLKRWFKRTLMIDKRNELFFSDGFALRCLRYDVVYNSKILCFFWWHEIISFQGFLCKIRRSSFFDSYKILEELLQGK